LPNVNTHHFSADSQLVIGRRFGEAFVSLQEKAKADASQPPKPAAEAATGRRPRARDLGITIGILPTGKLNAITDVAGVRVGHRSIIKGDDVRTGVTAVLPPGENIFQSKVPAAVHVANGFGKFVGSTQIQELGVIETPILLTNTLSTFAAADAVVAWSLRQKENEEVQSVNPVVGECNDGYLNDIRGQHVRAEDVVQAINDARAGVVDEGCVGAGVGTRCLGWKGGIGTSSRKLPQTLGDYTVGVLVQTNFDGLLTISGVPIGRELGRFYLKDVVGGQEHGSCIVIVATDAPLDARQLNRLASRATLGLAAVGSPITHGSGDYVLAFSTNERVRQPHAGQQAVATVPVLRDDRLSPLFQAVREATEEAVVNSLLKATTTTGRDGHKVEAIDPADVVRVCRKYGLSAKQ
jgi:D-aminopeptidase